MPGNITNTLQFELQRKTTNGSWTTIATSNTVEALQPDPTTGTITASGLLTTTFTASTLNWTNTAQYRIRVGKHVQDGATTINVGAAEGRIYSVELE